MYSGDSHDELLRRMQERRQTLMEQVACGNVPDVGGADGFWAMTGRVNECGDLIALVESVLFGRHPEEPDPKKPFDPLGIRGGL